MKIQTTATLILTILLALAACKKPGPPGKPVALSEVCGPKYAPELIKGDYKGQRVAVTGHFHMSPMFSMVSTTIMVRLSKDPAERKSFVSVSLRYNRGKNSLLKLPKKYKTADVQVKTNDGETVGVGAKITVHGERLGTDEKSCYIRVDRIERG